MFSKLHKANIWGGGQRPTRVTPLCSSSWKLDPTLKVGGWGVGSMRVPVLPLPPFPDCWGCDILSVKYSRLPCYTLPGELWEPVFAVYHIRFALRGWLILTTWNLEMFNLDSILETTRWTLQTNTRQGANAAPKARSSWWIGEFSINLIKNTANLGKGVGGSWRFPGGATGFIC